MSRASMLAIAALILARPAVALDLPDRCVPAYVAEILRVAKQLCPFDITMDGRQFMAFAKKVSDEGCTMDARRMVTQRRKEMSTNWCKSAMLIVNQGGHTFLSMRRAP
jgi:ABC-type polar amino acid transport system ATPase subunit